VEDGADSDGGGGKYKKNEESEENREVSRTMFYWQLK